MIRNKCAGKETMKTPNQNPFIPRREVMINSAGATYWNNMSPDLKQRFFIAYWTKDRLRQHLEMLKAFGFNAIQISACGQTAVSSGVKQEVWKEKLIQLCRLAKELDMGITQFVWGACFYDADRNAYVKDLDWHNPADRKRMEQFFQDEAFLAPWVDRVVTHWLDPGGPKKGCDQCSIDTAIEIHNVILAAFRAGNPKIRGIFSTWYFNFPLDACAPCHWRGYEGLGKLAASKTLDRNTDVAIGLSNRMADGIKRDPDGELKAADLEAIIASGRQAGVFG